MRKFLSASPFAVATALFAFCLIALLSINACRKFDRDSSDRKQAIETFFNGCETMPRIIKKVADKIKKDDAQYHFLGQFIEKEGYALWNKSVVQTHGASASQRLQGGGAYDSIVFIPLVQTHATKVHGYLACGVKGDSVRIRLIDGRVYAAFNFDSRGGAGATAEFIAASTMYFDQKVFADTNFYISDVRLFNNDSLSRANRHVVLEESSGSTTRLDGRVELFEQTICVTATIYPPLLAFRSTPLIIEICWTYEFWVDVIDDNDPFWPAGNGPSGGGGGGDWWNNDPCRVLPGSDPCGLGGGGGGNGWEPVDDDYETEDLSWMNNSMHDSSGNPCVDTVLNTLKSISAKLPRLIRDFYGVSPTFSVTYSLNFKDTIMIGGDVQFPPVAWTPKNLVDNLFLTYINSYYDGMTDLAYAAAILHEALHAQIFDWYRVAIATNDTAKQRQLAEIYGNLFTEVFNEDTDLMDLITGPQSAIGVAQHNALMNTYRDLMGEALYQFALARGIDVTLAYCKDLAWLGAYDSQAWKDLSLTEQQSIVAIIAAEEDPAGATVNYSPHTDAQGHPCL